MTTADLRRLIEAATPGPWEVDPTGDIGNHFIGTPEFAIATFEPIGADFLDDEEENQCDANAALTVALVNAAPRILALWEAAEKWLDVDDESVPTEVRHAAIRAAVRRMRGE